MASSCRDHHGHPMALHWDSWMGGCHGHLPWQAHVETTMGIPWHCIGTPGWVDAMGITMAIPWHCIGTPGWVDAMGWPWWPPWH